MESYPQPAGGDVTALLRLWSDGDEQAFERLMPLVYDELHRMALRYVAGERSDVSLQATALVNELCLRLLGWDQARWQNRGHFFGVSAQMMRQGAGGHRAPASRHLAAAEPARCVCRSTAWICPRTKRDMDLVAIDGALEKLAGEDPRRARLVELRFFGGLSMEETAQTLGVSVRTAYSEWAFARAWLYRHFRTTLRHERYTARATVSHLRRGATARSRRANRLHRRIVRNG